MPAPDEERPPFIALPPPSRDDIDALLAVVVRRLRTVERRIAGRDADLAGRRIVVSRNA